MYSEQQERVQRRTLEDVIVEVQGKNLVVEGGCTNKCSALGFGFAGSRFSL